MIRSGRAINIDIDIGIDIGIDIVSFNAAATFLLQFDGNQFPEVSGARGIHRRRFDAGGAQDLFHFGANVVSVATVTVAAVATVTVAAVDTVTVAIASATRCLRFRQAHDETNTLGL